MGKDFQNILMIILILQSERGSDLYRSQISGRAGRGIPTLNGSPGPAVGVCR